MRDNEESFLFNREPPQGGSFAIRAWNAAQDVIARLLAATIDSATGPVGVTLPAVQGNACIAGNLFVPATASWRCSKLDRDPPLLRRPRRNDSICPSAPCA